MRSDRERDACGQCSQVDWPNGNNIVMEQPQPPSQNVLAFGLSGLPKDEDYKVPFKSTGKFHEITLNVDRAKLTPEDTQKPQQRANDKAVRDQRRLCFDFGGPAPFECRPTAP
jgi:hypothetical protein